MSPDFCLHVGIPKSIHQALSHPGWHDVMLEEMNVLIETGAYDLVNLPFGKNVVGCKWVYAIKFNSNRSMAHLVAKGYAQTYKESNRCNFGQWRETARIIYSINLSIPLGNKTCFQSGN